MEGKYHDPEIRSGTQAYNRAMQFIVKAIGPGKIHQPLNCADVSQPIRPFAPCLLRHLQPAHRSALAAIPPFWIDRIHAELRHVSVVDGGKCVWLSTTPMRWRYPNFSEATNSPKRGRKHASSRRFVCGGNFIDSDAYDDPVAAQRVKELLTNPRINAVARQGIAFRPVISAVGSQWSQKHTGADAADVFYRDDSTEKEKAVLLAIFNFDSDHPAEKKVLFRQIGLDSSQHFLITDLWTGDATECKEGEHTWKLPPGEASFVHHGRQTMNPVIHITTAPDRSRKAMLTKIMK